MISPTVPVAPATRDSAVAPATSDSALVTSGRANRVRVGAAALAAGALVLALRAGGALDGLAGLLLAGTLLLAVPTSRLLSRRVLFSTVILVGWAPLLWWVDLPVGAVGRVTILLALGTAGLAGWLLSGPPRERIRRIVPRVGWTDAAVLPAALAAAAMASPWLRAANPQGALSMLMTGWDHSAHYDMTAMIRAHGVVIWATPPPDDGSWAYAHYPAGSHAVGAAMMELLRAGPVGTTGEEVELYARALGLLGVAVVVLVAAGVVAVPALRRRPIVAATGIGLLTATLAWGPTGLLLAEGFPNFLLACTLLGVIPLVVVSSGRWTAPVPLLVLGGALVGIAHSWALLLTMAAPMTLALLWPLRRRRAVAAPGGWVMVGLIVAATAASSLVALLVIRVQPLTDIVVLSGSVTGRSLGETGLTVCAFLVAIGLLAWRFRAGRSADVSRVLALALGPLTGIAVAAWIAYVQLGAGGLGYYFWKYVIALKLLLLVVAVVAAGMVASRSRVFESATWGAGTGAVVLVATLVAFGAPHPVVADVLALRPSEGTTGRTLLASAYDQPSPETTRLLAAAEVGRKVAGSSVYVPVDPTGLLGPASTGQWYAALSGQWTDSLNAPIGMLLSADLSSAHAGVAVGELLHAYPEITVVVPPSDADRIRASVGPSAWHRVVSW